MFIIEHRIFSVPSIFFKTAALRKIPLILPIKQSLFHAIRTYRSLGQTLIFSTIHGHNCLFWVYYAHLVPSDFFPIFTASKQLAIFSFYITNILP